MTPPSSAPARAQSGAGSAGEREQTLSRLYAPDAPRPELPELPAPPSGARVAAVAAAFAVLLAYAVFRYLIVKGDPLASLPLWMTNKAVAVLAVALIAAASLRPAAAWRNWARSAGLAAAALHGLASMTIMDPAYYRKLYEGGPAGRMTGQGELVILCGALALVAYAALRLPRPPGARTSRFASRTATAGAALVLVHCVALGLPGWLAPRSWPGGLPPMTMIGAALALVPLGAALVSRARAGRGRDPAAPLRAAPPRAAR